MWNNYELIQGLWFGFTAILGLFGLAVMSIFFVIGCKAIIKYVKEEPHMCSCDNKDCDSKTTLNMKTVEIKGDITMEQKLALLDEMNRMIRLKMRVSKAMESSDAYLDRVREGDDDIEIINKSHDVMLLIRDLLIFQAKTNKMGKTFIDAGSIDNALDTITEVKKINDELENSGSLEKVEELTKSK